MKRFLLIYMLIVTVLMYGCNAANNVEVPGSINADTSRDIDGDQDTKPESTNEETTAEVVEELNITTYLYNDTEDLNIFSLDGTKDFFNVEFNNKDAKPALTKECMGKEYSLTYVFSVRMPIGDLMLDNYSVNDIPGAFVCVNSADGGIVKYVNFPYSGWLETEDQYLQYIKNDLIDSRYDLSQYDYLCTTHYYESGEKYFTSTVTDGFMKCGDNQSIGHYSFYYNKSYGTLQSIEHITVEFDADSFTLEIYDFDYSEELVSRAEKNMQSIAASVEKFLISAVTPQATRVSVSFKGVKFFMNDGKPYVLIYSDILCSIGSLQITRAAKTITQLTFLIQ